MKQTSKSLDYLQHERINFLQVCSKFIDSFNFENDQYEGRPKFYFKDILKSLLLLTLNGLSYRRVQSDLEIAKMLGIISSIPKKSTLNKYMMKEELTLWLDKLIQTSAMIFVSSEDTLIVDSTWFTTKMYNGGYNKKPYNNPNKFNDIPPLEKCRKLHVGCLSNSKMIAFAKPTLGTTHDSPIFKEIISTICNNGFNIDKCLADAGYLSKENYALCESLGVKQTFIDFKSNTTGKHPKSKAYREAFRLFKHEPEIWHEDYRFRVIIEGVFSVIKRKFLNWLRTEKDVSRDNEMMLKVLAYNLTILNRY